MNDFGVTNVETKKKSDVRASGGKFNYSFAPHSFTLIKGRVN
jgi:alpha-N-arabinofuranosidase